MGRRTAVSGKARGGQDGHRFAFVLHPLTVDYLASHPHYRWTRRLPRRFVEVTAAYMPAQFVRREFFLRVLGPRQFELVVAVEVLEHLVDPAAALTAAVRSLKPGGVLAFQTAHYDPATCGRDWWYVGPANGHVSLFSAGALDVLFKRLGGMRRVVWNGYAGVQAWQV